MEKYIRSSSPEKRDETRISPLALLAQTCKNIDIEFGMYNNKRQETSKSAMSPVKSNAYPASPTLKMSSSTTKNSEHRSKPYKKPISNEQPAVKKPSVQSNVLNIQQQSTRHASPSWTGTHPGLTKMPVEFPVSYQHTQPTGMTHQYLHRYRSQVESQQQQQQQQVLYHTCNWLCGGNILCSQKFTSIDALNEHLKTHTTNELLSDLTRYFYARTTLLQNANTTGSISQQEPCHLFASMPYSQYFLMATDRL